MSAMRKPSSIPVKITAANHARLQAWSKAEGRPMAETVNDLTERHERDRFWDGVREDYERLRADADAWNRYQQEIALFEGASMDGLENEEPYYTPEEEEEIRAEFTRTHGG